jgi:hypothetical protein
MGRIVLFLFIVLISSCSKEYSEFILRYNKSVYIIPKDTYVNSVEAITWKVGPAFKQRVSKGIRVKVQFPQLEKDHLKHLNREKKINAWLVRVHKSTLRGTKIIGYLYFPLVTPGSRAGDSVRTRQQEFGIFNIYYAAASLSSRFENFYCPAFKHQKVIGSAGLNKRKYSLRKLIVSSSENERVVGRVEKFGYVPSSLNGGMEMKGVYNLDIAFYNSNSNMKKSNYVPLREEIQVAGEYENYITGCTNFKIPPAKFDDGDRLRKFNFGRKKFL